MAALIAGSAGLLAIFSGVQFSRLGPADGHMNGLRYQAHDAKQPAEQPDSLASSPIDAQLHRQPSVVEVIESKWFGSVESSNPSSHFHDSAASMSPPERCHRPGDAPFANIGRSAAKAYSAAAAAAAPATLRSGSRSGSSGPSSGDSRASSVSRQIAVSVNGSSAHWNGTTQRRRLPSVPAAGESQPDTPDWMDRSSLTGNLSALDSSEAPTPLANASELGNLTEEEVTQHGGGSAAAALARAQQQAQQQQQQHDKTPSELFGTWARRQKHFPREAAQIARPSTDTAGGDDAAGSHSSAAVANGAVEQRHWKQEGGVQAPHQRAREAAAAAHRGHRASDTDDDDRAKEHAWRWRFGRRWAAEQAKQWDPEYGKQAGDEDGWDEALGYLDAVGPGIHLQIGRTVSVDKTLGKASLYRDGSASFMLEPDSLQDEGMLSRGSSDYNATRSLGAVARKAQELLKRQKEIDQDVSRQWGDTRAAGISWAGQFMPAVTIDMHGRFEFLLLRAADASGMHKLLVRGKNGSTQGQLLQAAKLEAAQQAQQRQVPLASIEIIGSGVMTWSRDRDRCINVSDGRVVKGSDTAVRTHADAGRLAGALTSCSLPMNYRVTVDGQRMM